MDNNAAELYNSIVAKFVGGKRINFTSRRSYGTRCEVAAISYNVAPAELPRLIHKRVVKYSPGFYTKKVISARSKRQQWKAKRLLIKKTTPKKKPRVSDLL